MSDSPLDSICMTVIAVVFLLVCRSGCVAEKETQRFAIEHDCKPPTAQSKESK